TKALFEEQSMVWAPFRASGLAACTDTNKRLNEKSGGKCPQRMTTRLRPGIRSGNYWPVPKLRSLGAAIRGQARFGVTGRWRRPLPRLPRAALVPPVRADGRTRSAREGCRGPAAPRGPKAADHRA